MIFAYILHIIYQIIMKKVLDIVVLCMLICFQT